MQNVVNYLKNVSDANWEQSKFQLLFCLAIIVILLLEKETWKKNTFAWYAVICVIGLLNPITVKITSKIWGESVAYYCRQFSLIPIFMMIAYGMVLLIAKAKELLKVIIIFFFLILIVINGKLIYQENWYVKAQNFEKIPNDVIQIVGYFNTLGEKVKIAVPTSLSSYVRQYDNIIQVQGRQAEYNEIENLAENESDVMEKMQFCAKESCDYLITRFNDETEEIYEKAGYDVCYRTDNYLVYKVEKVERKKNIYDSENRVIKTININDHDEISCEKDGYAIISYEYDSLGNILMESYYDEKEKPIKLSSGEHAVKYKYDKKQRIVEKIYLDENGKLTQIEDGYAIIKFLYDDKGNKIGEYYFDNNNLPKALETGQYAVNYKYDEMGRVAQIIWLDENNNPIITEYGYAIVNYTYDNYGNKVKESYYDKNEKPISLEEGQHAIEYCYDDNHHVISKTYIGQDGNKVQLSYGYTTVKYNYDGDGNKVSEYYYDLNGQMIKLPTGEYGCLYEYDNNEIKKIIYVDNRNNPISRVEGYSSVIFNYDENGKLIDRFFYDIKGKRVYL